MNNNLLAMRTGGGGGGGWGWRMLNQIDCFACLLVKVRFVDS